jgi:DNA recombination protein RmuC
MLAAVVVLQVLLLIAIAVLLMRRPAAAAPPDPRQLQLPDQLARVDGFVRDALAQLRQEIPNQASLNRTESADAATNLRRELIQNLTALGSTLQQGLEDLRGDNKTSANALRAEVDQKMQSISRGFSELKQETIASHAAFKEALGGKLNELMASNSTQQDRLRTAVEGRLDQLNATNAAKLDEMRATVDEKLHATLHTRLTESFGQVTDQLNKVHSGLGEMSKLSEGMDDLSRIFTNVKSRGGFAEVQLGMLLEQMLAPSQFVRNARVKPNTQEVVEFAVRFPSAAGEVLLPIDAKFPREDWERLEDAYTANDADLLAAAGKAFELAIRVEGKRICEKYINPPKTTPHAIMFLPTEGLYAEVMRRGSLQAEIQSKCQVTIAGPSTLSAILTSFQMGFHMLALQEKGDEVWKVLESAKHEFGKFGGLMDKVEKQVGTVQNTLREIGSKTTTINRTLREVGDTGPTGELDFGEAPAAPLRLVANAEE